MCPLTQHLSAFLSHSSLLITISPPRRPVSLRARIRLLGITPRILSFSVSHSFQTLAYKIASIQGCSCTECHEASRLGTTWKEVKEEVASHYLGQGGIGLVSTYVAYSPKIASRYLDSSCNYWLNYSTENGKMNYPQLL
ncbi:hypothetical protein AAZV13_13G014700 [Glycine max]|uniref:uncharacterized protein isoform X1 n=1 Tax=Glycine max TaxID=3847 RepID=UPI0007192943|nr:uncharacterized protein LOC102664137 isoform X1 [Glycine max]XP_014621915.1 uncharacterized protein LOC102664137 isoform X1 [Glycine max]XP_028196112.1 uncharacterized protein LOC114381129 isoform X2 [Glycine soja]XP_028196114.1 uncharacterized protein LOC114381129 isoform X2 [Glycine soja]|eukprot:XP_014621913.1 uncharacterized protein LOC102664137 isoform X2 [Glycine max]